MKPFHRKFRIVKASGRVEPFSKRKLYLSLERSGLPKRQCQSITNRIADEISEGTRTRDIYKKAARFVKATSPIASIRYSLKKAIFALGPEGHHFESYVARYFEETGHRTETCQNLTGKLVNHEVDVVATSKGKKTFVECKFHNRQGIKNDIKVSLYVKARWDDLRDGPAGKELEKFFVVSNTAFSLDAITYANGSGLRLLGLNAPSQNSFLDEIKKLNLYPVTSLTRINRLIKKELLSRGVILVKELPYQKQLLYRLGMKENEIQALMDEVSFILGKRL